MPKVAHLGHLCTGHAPCFPPRGNIEGEPTFTIGGKPAHCQGHAYPPHGKPPCVPHAGVLASGAPRFTVAGRQLGRIGDPVSCGSSVAEGFSTFTCGD